MLRSIATLLVVLAASTSAHSPPEYMVLIALYIEEGVATASETCAQRFPTMAGEWYSNVASWRESNEPYLNELRKLRESVEARAEQNRAPGANNAPGINILTLHSLRTTMHARAHVPLATQPDVEAERHCATTHRRLLEASTQRELLESAKTAVSEYLRKN